MRLFHVLNSNPDCHVPYDFVKEHEQQARSNHCGQSVAKLNERGGLDWAELYYVINDRYFDFKEAEETKKLVYEYKVLCAVNEWICGQEVEK